MAAVSRTDVGARGLSLDRPVQWAVAVTISLLVLFPLLPILLQSVSDQPLYEAQRAFTLGNFRRVFTSAAFWRVVGTTALFAGCTTVLAVGLGGALALLLTRTDVPLRGLFSNLVVIPFYISPLVLAFAWGIIFGKAGYLTIAARAAGLPTWDLGTLGGIVAVATVYYAPYTYLYCSASLALSDPQLEDAARIGGARPLRALWAITLPLLRPALAYSVLLTLVSSLELLSIPLVLGSPAGVEVLSTYLYTLGIVGTRTDYGAVAAVSVAMLILITGLVWLQERLVTQERRFVTVGGKATRPRRLSLGPWRWLGFALLVLYVLLGILLPLAGIVAQSATSFLSPLANPLELLTTEHYDAVLGTEAYRRSIWNSLLISVIGGGVGIAFIAVAALIMYRSDFPGRRTLAYLALYPRSIPGIIVGVGFLWAFLLLPGIGGLRNTIWALTAAFIMRHLPLGFGAVAPSILRVSSELDRAARVTGASWLRTARSIMLPILKPALLSGYFLLFMTFLKEYSAALFLFARGSEVIGTTMIELSRQGDIGPVSALATIQLGITTVVLIVSRWLLGAKLHG